VELSTSLWHDISEDCPDPDAVQCLAYGVMGKANGNTIYLLTRYEDKGAEYALVAYAENKGNKERAITSEQFKLEWLWQKVTATGRREDD